MMKNLLEYKGYYGKVEYSVEDQILFGKIEGIVDLVTFESKNADEIEKEFRDAVDDYLDFCHQVGKEPEKTYKGTFNVRIDPELHKAIAIEAMKKGKSEWVHLPCKVGDEVYFVDASHYRCDAEDCYCCDNEGDIESKYDRHICEFAKFTPSVVEMKMRNINDIFHWFPYFGKTIFLTREEAEKSIEDMRKEDEGK